MSIRGRIESRLRTSSSFGSKTIGGQSFPPMTRDTDRRLDATVKAVAAINAAVIELAREVDKLADDIHRQRAA